MVPVWGQLWDDIPFDLIAWKGAKRVVANWLHVYARKRVQITWQGGVIPVSMSFNRWQVCFIHLMTTNVEKSPEDAGLYKHSRNSELVQLEFKNPRLD